MLSNHDAKNRKQLGQGTALSAAQGMDSYFFSSRTFLRLAMAAFLALIWRPAN
jgi:hypothetical protein